MRSRLILSLILALAAPVHAQWTTSVIYSGTATDIPVGVAMQAFGPTHDVVFVVERRDGPTGAAPQHFLTLQRFVCPAGCAVPGVPPRPVPPADQVPPDGLTNNQYYNPSLALKGSPLPPLLEEADEAQLRSIISLESAHIVRRTGPTAQCSNEELNLSEEEYQFDSLTWLHYDIDANTLGNCQDRVLSYTLQAGGTLYSCWTLDPTTDDKDNQVWCGSRTIAGGAWSASVLADGDEDQDHAWFDFDAVDGWRYIVHRNRDTSPDSVTLHVPELGRVGDMPVGLNGSPDERDYPSIVRASDNSYHAVWHAPKNGGGHIRYARCPATIDCTVAANWVAPVEIRTALGARHAEIAAWGNGRLMVMWMEKDAATVTASTSRRPARAPPGPNGPGQVPRPAAGLAVDQSNFMGRPHISIDDAFALVHLAFVEFDSWTNPTDGDVYWARKTLVACP